MSEFYIEERIKRQRVSKLGYTHRSEDLPGTTSRSLQESFSFLDILPRDIMHQILTMVFLYDMPQTSEEWMGALRAGADQPQYHDAVPAPQHPESYLLISKELRDILESMPELWSTIAIPRWLAYPRTQGEEAEAEQGSKAKEASAQFVRNRLRVLSRIKAMGGRVPDVECVPNKFIAGELDLPVRKAVLDVLVETEGHLSMLHTLEVGRGEILACSGLRDLSLPGMVNLEALRLSLDDTDKNSENPSGVTKTTTGEAAMEMDKYPRLSSLSLTTTGDLLFHNFPQNTVHHLRSMRLSLTDALVEPLWEWAPSLETLTLMFQGYKRSIELRSISHPALKSLALHLLSEMAAPHFIVSTPNVRQLITTVNLKFEPAASAANIRDYTTTVLANSNLFDLLPLMTSLESLTADLTQEEQARVAEMAGQGGLKAVQIKSYDFTAPLPTL